MSIPDDLVLVAHVSGAFGIAGWIRIRPYSSDASALLSAKTWWLDKPALHDVEVLQVRAQGEDLVARLMGIEVGKPLKIFRVRRYTSDVLTFRRWKTTSFTGSI